MFSDGVFAVLITVLVPELRPPELPTFRALLLLWPTWVSYAVSYLFIAIVWANHHHLLHYAKETTPRLMWLGRPESDDRHYAGVRDPAVTRWRPQAATKLVVIVGFPDPWKGKGVYYDPNDPFKRIRRLRQLIFRNNTVLFDERSGCPSDDFFWHET
jgi:hypothetical protein